MTENSFNKDNVNQTQGGNNYAIVNQVENENKSEDENKKENEKENMYGFN